MRPELLGNVCSSEADGQQSELNSKNHCGGASGVSGKSDWGDQEAVALDVSES